MSANKELVKLMQKYPDKVYDYICNNYTRFSRNELVDIIKELVYALRDDPLAMVDAGDELKERWHYLLEEEKG